MGFSTLPFLSFHLGMGMNGYENPENSWHRETMLGVPLLFIYMSPVLEFWVALFVRLYGIMTESY